jgi:hypothetical protein
MKAVYAGLALFLACSGAHALSVDCGKITNPDENTICSEVSLVKLEKEMVNAYALMQANLPLKMRDYMKNAQGQWVAGQSGPASGNCKGDVNCIATRYRDRIAYLSNPGLRYEGVYVGKKARFSIASFTGGVLRVGFFPDDNAGGVAPVNESQGLKVAGGALGLPPPAENCAMRVEFNDAGAVVQLKEAKKKACDSVKMLAGPYTRDLSLAPAR